MQSVDWQRIRYKRIRLTKYARKCGNTKKKRMWALCFNLLPYNQLFQFVDINNNTTFPNDLGKKRF